jgi:putative ABC transport system permease protein
MDRRSVLDALSQDVRYGARMLARNPAATGVIVLTLTLAIGASTAMFSVVDGVLLRPLPYPKPDQIVSVSEVSARGSLMNVADPNFDDLRAMNRSFSAMAEYGSDLESVSASPEPVRVTVAAGSRDFFAVFGVPPVQGRLFIPDEQREGAAAAALVSDSFWRQHLGSATDLSQRSLRVGKDVVSIVGVLPPGFRFPGGADIWVPRERFGETPSRTAHNYAVVGRLRDGVTPAQAHVDLGGIARRLQQQYGSDTNMTDAAVSPLRDTLTGRVRTTLFVLLGAVGFLLLVACANVANLLLSQAATRERELSIRSALGASRWRLLRQFLTEALVLTFVGGGLGVLASQWSLAGLLAVAPSSLPRVDEVSTNLSVLLFSLGVSLIVATGLGLFTAWRATAVDPQAALAAGGRADTGGAHSQRVGRFVVATQFALTMILLVGAGLLARSLLRVLTVDPGFRTDGIVTMNLALPSVSHESGELARRGQLLDDLLARLRRIPGVDDVGGTNVLPLGGFRANGTFIELATNEVPTMEGLTPLFSDKARTGDADYCVASEGYFHVLGIPLKRGRVFDNRDVADAPHVAVISESVANSATWMATCARSPSSASSATRGNGTSRRRRGRPSTSTTASARRRPGASAR